MSTPRRAAARADTRDGGDAIRLNYTLTFKDLYWMYETSGVGIVATIALAMFGLFLMSAVFIQGDLPVGEDVAYGAILIIASPFLAPVTMMAVRLRPGHRIDLLIDDAGVYGWPAWTVKDTSWSNLRRPRVESRILVLPFSWPSAYMWVAIPPRAFTTDSFALFLRLAQAHGHLSDGNRASIAGCLLAAVADRLPNRGHEPGLSRYPSIPRLRASGERSHQD